MQDLRNKIHLIIFLTENNHVFFIAFCSLCVLKNGQNTTKTYVFVLKA